MTQQVLRVTEFLDPISGHLTEQGIEAIDGYCSDKGGLPEELILAIRLHMGLFAGSSDFRECDADCQKRLIDSLGEDGVRRAVEKRIFTWAPGSESEKDEDYFD